MKRAGSPSKAYRTIPPGNISPCRGLWRVALLLGLLWAVLHHPTTVVAQPAANGEPATLDQYIAALQEVRQELASAPGEQGALEASRDRLQPLQQVLLPSGDVVELDPLLGEPGQTLDAAEALARVEAALAQLGAAEGDASAARLAVLAAVLAGPQFTAGESWWDLLLQWFSQWLGRILPSAPESAASSKVTQQAGDFLWWTVGIAGAIALALLLAYWLRGFLGSFIGAAAAADGGPNDLPQTPEDARRRAAGLAAGGDYRNAVRNLYLSALLTLEQNGLVPIDRSLTNREVLRRISPNHPVAGRLQPVVETFDEVWYGVHEPDDQTYRQYTEEIDALESLAVRPVPARDTAQGGEQP